MTGMPLPPTGRAQTASESSRVEPEIIDVILEFRGSAMTGAVADDIINAVHSHGGLKRVIRNIHPDRNENSTRSTEATQILLAAMQMSTNQSRIHEEDVQTPYYAAERSDMTGIRNFGMVAYKTHDGNIVMRLPNIVQTAMYSISLQYSIIIEMMNKSSVVYKQTFPMIGYTRTEIVRVYRHDDQFFSIQRDDTHTGRTSKLVLFLHTKPITLDISVFPEFIPVEQQSPSREYTYPNMTPILRIQTPPP